MRVPQQKLAAGVASVGVVLIIAVALQAGSEDGGLGESGVTDETVWVEPSGGRYLPPSQAPAPVTTTAGGEQRSTRQGSEASTTTFPRMQTCAPDDPYGAYVILLFDKGEPLTDNAVSILGVDISRFGVSTQQEVLDLGYSRASTIADQYRPPPCGDEFGLTPRPEPASDAVGVYVPYSDPGPTSSTSSTPTSSTDVDRPSGGGG